VRGHQAAAAVPEHAGTPKLSVTYSTYCCHAAQADDLIFSRLHCSCVAMVTPGARPWDVTEHCDKAVSTILTTPSKCKLHTDKSPSNALTICRSFGRCRCATRRRRQQQRGRCSRRRSAGCWRHTWSDAGSAARVATRCQSLPGPATERLCCSDVWWSVLHHYGLRKLSALSLCCADGLLAVL